MEYSKFFSEDTASFVSSPTREIFKKVDINSIYSLAGGYPDPSAYPLAEFEDCMQEVIRKYGPRPFQYGATQGVTELRQAVAKRFSEPIERVQITTSSQQGIDVCARVLIDPGDVIVTSDPTYLGALQSFKSYRAEMAGVRHEDDPERFLAAYEAKIERLLSEGKRVKMIYMIPDFQNPSGETLTLEERKILVAVAEKYDMLILEDCPYKELRYEGEDLPSLYSMAPERVIHLGSFSKILCPGLRIGWMFAAPEILQKIYVCKQALDLCPPVFDQYFAAEFLSSGRLDANLEKSKVLYRRKRDLMLRELETNMPAGVSWTHPQGGLFLFLTLPEKFDAMAFYDTALSAGVAYVAGNMFFTDFVSNVGKALPGTERASDAESLHDAESHRHAADAIQSAESPICDETLQSRDSHAVGVTKDSIAGGVTYGSRTGLNTMRLNFSFLPEDKLVEGVRLLCRLVTEALA